MKVEEESDYTGLSIFEDGKVEISAVNPIASMMGVENESLGDVAGEVKDKLERVIDAL